MSKFKFIGIIALLIFALALVSCGGDEGDVSGEEVRIAVENAYTPFNFYDPDSGEAIGYDYDLFAEICRVLECEPVFVETSWDAMLAVMGGTGEFDTFDIGADGITITDLALEEAFADLGVDTIYLITDGAPTHVGSRGGFPEDAEELIKSIHRSTKAINFLRGVRIFTLGFRGAEEEFLKKLSRDHSGKYVRVE